jgi:hypothetical protein
MKPDDKELFDKVKKARRLSNEEIIKNEFDRVTGVQWMVEKEGNGYYSATHRANEGEYNLTGNQITMQNYKKCARDIKRHVKRKDCHELFK